MKTGAIFQAEFKSWNVQAPKEKEMQLRTFGGKNSKTKVH